MRLAAIRAFRAIDGLRVDPHRYVLILSHMRSGSSLLLHLLLTSREISGIGERNSAYRSADDLAILAIKANWLRRGRRLARYSVDQLNHTHWLPAEELLAHPQVIPIILFRNPVDTIGSMADVFPQFGEFNLEDGVEHYRERVRTLTRYAEIMRPHSRLFVLTYDELVIDTGDVLRRLQEYLELKSRLVANYPTHDFTGRFGDPSSRIGEGRILPPRRHTNINIDASTLAELEAIYDRCRRVTRINR